MQCNPSSDAIRFYRKKGCYPSFKRPYIKETDVNATAKARKAEPEKPLKPDGKP